MRDAGHSVFDFRTNTDKKKFGSDGGYVDPDWAKFKSPEKIRDFLTTDKAAVQCYARDRKALEWADTCIAVCPSGISAALEVAWSAGQGKLTIVYLGEGTTKGELMWHLCDVIVTSIPELLDVLEKSTIKSESLRHVWGPSGKRTNVIKFPRKHRGAA